MGMSETEVTAADVKSPSLLGAIIASLALAGVITMTAAIISLIVAFILIMIATFALDHLWQPSWKHRIIVAVIAAVALTAIAAYEWKNFSAPLSAKDIATAVVGQLKGPPAPTAVPVAAPQTTASTPAAEPNSAASAAPVVHLPAFDLSDHSKATLKGTAILGDPHGVVKATGGSEFTMEDSIISSGEGVPFPPPSGALSSLSNGDLRGSATQIISSLKQLGKINDNEEETVFRQDYSATQDIKQRDKLFKEQEEKMATVLRKRNSMFKDSLRPHCLDLASEIIKRVGPIKERKKPNNIEDTIKMADIQRGAEIVTTGKLAGPHPLDAVASFIEFIVGKIPL